MDKSQRQTIQEVLDAAIIHRTGLVTLRRRFRRSIDEDTLADVLDGMDISVTKLQILLKEDKKKA
jgi:hypothetical protein